MTLETLQAAMIAAMKEHNKPRKDAISSLVEAVKKATIQKTTRVEITEELVDATILKEKKVVQEMIDTCPAERNELLQEYKEKMKVIEEFAPKLITDEFELKNMVEKFLEVADIEPLKKNKGQIMKTVMPELKGKADMKITNKVIDGMLR